MENEDMSEILQKLSSMINNSDTSTTSDTITNNDVSSHSNNINEDTIQNILNNLNINTNSSENFNTENNNNFNFDINTILKMKSIIDKINNNKNDPRSNLLLSLKPYLNNDRKQKLDQYIQFLNITKVIEAFNSEGGVNNK